jgi:Family of unknown function (DUF5995)
MRSHPLPAPLTVLLVALAGLLVAAFPAPARADDLPSIDLSSDPWFVDWAAALPPTYLGVDTDSSDACVAGQIQCVDKVARRLERQLSGLGCDHNAIFSLAYARTTEMIAEVERDQPAFFADTPWLNHYDVTFADMYASAWNSWQTSHTAPEAWKIAFDAADHERVSAAGNLLLGMSAHVNRDLPFTLYAIGLVAPDGSSRKPDHDRVNAILNMVIEPLIDEIATSYDPSVRVLPDGESLQDLLEFQLLPAWRQQAWNDAERLTDAPDAAARATIAADIEQSAADEARTLRSLTAYLPPVTTAAARDSFCQAHVGT